MRRKIYIVYLAFSLLLWVGMIAWTIRGYYGNQFLQWSSSFRLNGSPAAIHRSISNVDGRLVLTAPVSSLYMTQQFKQPPLPWEPFDAQHVRYVTKMVGWKTYAVDVAKCQLRLHVAPVSFPAPWYVEYDLPSWGVVIFLSLFPMAELVRHGVRVRRRHQKAGRCVGCGYDLRATPERCPECGLEDATWKRKKEAERIAAKLSDDAEPESDVEAASTTTEPSTLP